MLFRTALAAALALTIAALVPAAAPAKTATTYYLALGDSLSVGVQPNPGGTSVETNQGYTDQLAALERRRIRGLKLYKLGCGGESTSSMLGIGNRTFCQYRGDRRLGYGHRRKGSQIAAAEKFLREHRGHVAFVTIDIGANDVEGCGPGGHIDTTCLTNGINAIKTNTPKIARRLRAAAGRSVTIVAMNLYDPFLEFYFDPAMRAIAQASAQLAVSVNKSIGDGSKRNGIHKVADVFKAFETLSTTPTTYRGQRIPRDVERICTLTWMCAPRPRGPNVHANRAGYGLIARTFKPLI